MRAGSNLLRMKRPACLPSSLEKNNACWLSSWRKTPQYSATNRPCGQCKTEYRWPKDHWSTESNTSCTSSPIGKAQQKERRWCRWCKRRPWRSQSRKIVRFIDKLCCMVVAIHSRYHYQLSSNESLWILLVLFLRLLGWLSNEWNHIIDYSHRLH